MNEQPLDFIYKESHGIALQADLKIPETFILSNSVIIVYISTLTDKNFPFYIAVVSFFAVITLSLTSLWKIRNIHVETALSVSDSQAKFRELSRKTFRSVEELQVKIKEINEAYVPKGERIRSLRNLIIFLQRLSFLFFIYGLVGLILQPLWGNLHSELRAQVIKVSILIIFISILFMMEITFNIFRKFFINITNKKH